ncbi:MAG: cysteate synthase [Thermoplasmata archaeon]|nr:cysteate synthase [Thermoplasmata archaeon]
MGDYELICLDDGSVVEERYTLSCGTPGHSGLLRTRYASKTLDVKPHGGVFKFHDWLPVRSVIPTESAPVAFRSEGLSKELGLRNLTVAFTGYYPERGAKVKSCTFKEMEALPTYARLADCGGGTIVVASAGNTARAFAQIASETGNRCVIVVPRSAEDRISVTEDNGNAKLLAVDGDYFDAIRTADRIVALGGYVSEGGARNVARRDGMGTVMLEGALSMGRVPDRYFQAVGSGTGGISAWEASMRLIGDGRYGDRLPKLHLAQNAPFTPMAKAWNAGRRTISDEDLGDPARDIPQVYADVLTNRKPPYSMAGGVFDAMTACGGSFLEVTNDEARSAEKLWMSIENARPDPAASVALASLMKSVEDGSVSADEHILLNMTGGGLDRAREELSMVTVRPSARISPDIAEDELRGVLDA